MRNLCFNRFTLRTEDATTRRKILRWLALNYRLYEYNPAGNEVTGRFVTRKPFPMEVFRQPTQGTNADRTLYLRIISADLDTLYLEGNIYLSGRWYDARL